MEEYVITPLTVFMVLWYLEFKYQTRHNNRHHWIT